MKRRVQGTAWRHVCEAFRVGTWFCIALFILAVSAGAHSAGGFADPQFNQSDNPSDTPAAFNIGRVNSDHHIQLPATSWAPNPIWESVGLRLGFMMNMMYQWDRFVVWAYEAQMILGFGVSAGPVAELNCFEAKSKVAQQITSPDKKSMALDNARNECYLFTNPVSMSTYDEDYYKKYLRLDASLPVVVYYGIPTVSIAGIFTKTKDWIYGIYQVDPNLDIPESYHIDVSRIPLASIINPQEGTIEGRIVQASVDHPIRKTYEVIIQEQENETNFTAMSVNDEGLFHFIKLAMFTGKNLSISFVRLFAPEGGLISAIWPYDTYYRVTGVKILHK